EHASSPGAGATTGCRCRQSALTAPRGGAAASTRSPALSTSCYAANVGGTPLDSCDFDVDLVVESRSSDLSVIERHGNSWIRRALRRHIRELGIPVSITQRLPFALSDLPLCYEHMSGLTRLELEGVQGVLAFSGCPALVHLMMEDCLISSLEMYSPSLKHLSIRFCLFYYNYCARTSFSSLVSFRLNKIASRAPLLESIPSLETAKVKLHGLCDDRCARGCCDDCGYASCPGCYYYYGLDDIDCVFLQGSTEAIDLKLTACPEVYVFNRDLRCCPPFNKLKTSALHEWFVSDNLH
ncbi:hypothetical protein BS78_01G263800, partial [Paspalum vaginatum]